MIAGLYVLFAFLPLHIHTSFFIGLDLPTARNNTGRIFAWLGCGTIKFFGSVLAVALSAGAITSEIDRGVLVGHRAETDPARGYLSSANGSASCS